MYSERLLRYYNNDIIDSKKNLHRFITIKVIATRKRK